MTAPRHQLMVSGVSGKLLNDLPTPALGCVTPKPRIWVCRNQDHPWNYRYCRLSFCFQFPPYGQGRAVIIGGMGCSHQVSFGPADSAFTPINVRMARDPGAFGARIGSCELHGGCCCEVLARFVISRHGTGTDVIYPAMQGEITLDRKSVV